MDEKMKNLFQVLGEAINESLSDSDRIAEAIGEIKRAGYDLFLVLEASIGFAKRDKSEESESYTSMVNESGQITWSTKDEKFLKALRISSPNERDK